MTQLKTNNLSLGYGDKIVIDSLNIEIPKNKITIFVGANGCGKSTILRSLARLLKPKGGQILLDQKDINKINPKKVAKKLSILPQGPTAPDGLSVLQLVKQGRYPHQNWLNQWSKEDEKVVNQVLKSTELSHLKDRPIHSLSGGQRQRAWIAMCLCQKTDIILLDEPTTYLDLAHQIEVLDLLFELNEKNNRTIVMVLHDLNLACRYAHNIVAIKDKKIFCQGKPENVITSKNVESVFGMKCKIGQDDIFGTPICIPYGKGRVISNKKIC